MNVCQPFLGGHRGAPIDVFWQTGHAGRALAAESGKPLNKMHVQWPTPDILPLRLPCLALENRTASGGSVREKNDISRGSRSEQFGASQVS